MFEGAWGTFAILGVVLLGGAIAWAMFKNNQADTPHEVARSDRGSQDLYAAESEREIEEERRAASLGRSPGGPDPRLNDPTVPGQDAPRR